MQDKNQRQDIAISTKIVNVPNPSNIYLDQGIIFKAFGQGNLPVRGDTPGEAQDNVADTTLLKSLGWFPTINVLDVANGKTPLEWEERN